jgi:peptidoglycan/xylan/chitin deacetylase (PgdA/CDA1 family)
MCAVLKSTAAVIARYSGLGKTLAFRYAGRGTIFGLHSIVNDEVFCPDAFLHCSVSALQYTLTWLKDNGVQVVHFDEAIKLLARPSVNRFCVFTFDDGYADNLTRALPIMEHFGAPFTVYITTGMLTGDADAWWLGLARLVLAQDHVEFPELGWRFECQGKASKKRAFSAITSLIDSCDDALLAVKRAIAAAGIDCRELIRSEGLSAHQLRQLAASPLVTIGAHGVEHVRLPRASIADVEREMSMSRRLLQEIIDREVVHFSYPFGACGEREASIAHSVGFRTAVTTQRGSLFRQHLEHIYELPREPIHEKETSATIRCKIDGVYRAFHSRLGDPVAHF